MKAFREILSFWNEAGLGLSILISIGYFGSRRMLGHLPAVSLIAVIVGALVLSYFIAQAQTNPESENPFAVADTLLGWMACFALGIAIAVTIGSVL